MELKIALFLIKEKKCILTHTNLTGSSLQRVKRMHPYPSFFILKIVGRSFSRYCIRPVTTQTASLL